MFGLYIWQLANKWLPAEERKKHFQRWAKRRRKIRKELGILGLEHLPENLGANVSPICLPDTLPESKIAVFHDVPYQLLSPWTDEARDNASNHWKESLKLLHQIAPLMRNRHQILCLDCLKPASFTPFHDFDLDLPICYNCNSPDLLASPIPTLVAHLSPEFEATFQHGQLHFSVKKDGWHPSADPDVICIDEDLGANANSELASYLEFRENHQIGHAKQVFLVNQSQQKLEYNILHILEAKQIPVLAEANPKA
jgi:hypothetical protein